MSQVQPFHLAIPVFDVELARKFYREVLECKEGRSDKNWVDFDFFGHQLVIHYKPPKEGKKDHCNPVDGHDVPIPHFGIVLKWERWEQLATDLKKKDISFIIEPYVRFKGEVGEQGTMFFYDPCGNALEFKAFRDINQLFAK